MCSYFSEIVDAPPIHVFAVNKACIDDTFPDKVNLTIGAYRTDAGKPWVLPVVRKVEKQIIEDETLNHEYLPVLGLDAFTRAATTMLLGAQNKAVQESRAFGIQTLSGTGALRIGAAFLKTQLKFNTVYVSSPSWENHNMLFAHAGYGKILSYRYWDAKTKSLDFDGMCEDLSNAPPGSIVILHACAHNPTGCDPTEEQWQKLSVLIKEKNIFPFFDCAYQGFASGNLEQDSKAVRYFAEQGHELFCSQSFAKNFGLYGERIGNLTVVVNSTDRITQIKSQFQIIVRGMYSNPPTHGARIVSTVLTNSAYFDEWQEAIGIMSSRIKEMRKGLRERLEKICPSQNWEHITNQIGMFSYTGLSKECIDILKSKYHVYLLDSGRINICGLNNKNLDYVADSIAKTISDVGHM